MNYEASLLSDAKEILMTTCEYCGAQVALNDAYCRHCGSKLFREPTDVVYTTEGWSNQERAALTEDLLSAGIPHEWNGSDLTASRQYEAKIDEILATPHREANSVSE